MRALRDLYYSRYYRLLVRAQLDFESIKFGNNVEMYPHVQRLCSYVNRKRGEVFCYLNPSDTEGVRDLDFCMFIIELAAPFAGRKDVEIDGALSFAISRAGCLFHDRLGSSSKIGSAIFSALGNALSTIGIPLERLTDTRSLSEKYWSKAATIVDFAELTCILRDDEHLADFRAFSSEKIVSPHISEKIVNPHIQLKSKASKMREDLIHCCDYIGNEGAAFTSADLMDRYNKALAGW